MANSNEEEKKQTKQIKQNQASAPESPLKQQETSTIHNKISLLSGTAFIIAIIALVMTVYSNQTNKNVQQQLIDENKTLKTQVSELEQNQSGVQDLIDEKANKMQQNQINLQSRFDGLNKELQTAMSQRLYQNQDWILLKARYYLELAQINAHWSDNYKTTIALLLQADTLLNQLSTPKIFDIRQVIAKEIAQLKALPAPDLAGLLSQLDAAQLSVSNLTIQSTIDEEKVTTPSELPQSSNPSSWRTRFKDNVKLLEKLVIVRRTDENIQPLMSPLFESLIRESIRLNLQEAQWAILNHNSAVYQLALKQASTNIKRIFNEKEPNTAALLNQLSELQQIKLSQEKPETGLALPLLNQMIEHNELQNNQINSSEKGEH